MLGRQAFGWDRKAAGSSVLLAVSLGLWGVHCERPPRDPVGLATSGGHWSCEDPSRKTDGSSGRRSVISWHVTKPTDLDGFEKRVAAATTRLDDFFTELIGELDEVNGGFAWWQGHSDWKTLTSLADYLLQSIQGAEEALLSASLAAQVHRQMMFAEQQALKSAWTAVGKAGGSAADMMAAIPRDSQARRRALTITSSAEDCFFHLGQALDRLAAAAIIVGGFELPKASDVTSIYWSTLDQYATMLKSGNATSTVLQPLGTDGRSAQEALVVPVQDWQQYGVTDWLPWMRATRNAMTHRPVGMKLNMMTVDMQLTRLLYRQPKWSELQSLVFGAKPPAKPFFGSYLISASQDILDGLCDSTTKLVEALVLSMTSCWNARKAVPSMIVQHGAQWPVIEPPQPTIAFAGYGSPLKFAGDMLVMNPLDRRRWTAARITDDRRAEWY